MRKCQCKITQDTSVNHAYHDIIKSWSNVIDVQVLSIWPVTNDYAIQLLITVFYHMICITSILQILAQYIYIYIWSSLGLQMCPLPSTVSYQAMSTHSHDHDFDMFSSNILLQSMISMQPSINTLRVNDAYMLQWTWPPLVQRMA